MRDCVQCWAVVVQEEAWLQGGAAFAGVGVQYEYARLLHRSHHDAAIWHVQVCQYITMCIYTSIYLYTHTHIYTALVA